LIGEEQVHRFRGSGVQGFKGTRVREMPQASSNKR
jgi:hypothetical protein